MAEYSVNWGARVATAAGTITAGQCVVNSGSGYVVATSANRTSYGRPDGIAATTGDSTTGINIIEFGDISATLSGLGSGTAVPVRVSSAGALERVTTPGASDEVVGKCETDGRAHVAFGVLTHRVYVDGGGAGTPGGSDTQVQYNNASSFGGISGVTTDGTGLTALKVKDSSGGQYYTFASSNLTADRTVTLPLLTGADTFVFETHAATLTNKTINGASNTLTVRLASDVSGTLPVANGGTGITSLGAGVATWLGTPSGANLASALTTALPDSKGGTGLTALGTGVATWLGTPSGANLASALTSALPDSKGGTGLTALGAGVATWLGTPSGANLASALSSALPYTKGGTGLTALGTALQVLRTNAGENAIEWGTVSATPAGASGDLQTNNAGAFGSLTPGSGVSTWLATPSSANLASCVTGETGSGALVFGTSPTVSGATLNGTSIIAGIRHSGVTTNSSTGTLNNVSLGGNRIIDFTHATGPTVTGFDATGISAGDVLIIIASGGVMALNHEDAGSSAANRFSAGSGASATVSTGMIIYLIYYGSRWHTLAGNAI